MIKVFLTSILLLVLLTGCGSNTPNSVDTPDLKNKVIVTKQVREDDIVSFGQYAEIWVAPYKDSDGDLYDERTMYFWVKEADFKIGEELSYKTNAKTNLQNAKHKDFSINSFDLKNENNKEKKIELNKEVKKFLEIKNDKEEISNEAD